MRKLRLTTILLLYCLFPSTSAALDLDETTFRAPKLGIILSAPEGWILTRQTGYPNILALMLAPAGNASISLAVGKLEKDGGLPGYVARNNSALSQIGLRVNTSKPATPAGQTEWEVISQNKQATIEIRQLYFHVGLRVYVLTLTCPHNQREQFISDLDDVVRSFQRSV
ncbi:MAG: hypothetical protein V1754_11160 [Pseudomonadota bacterium]